MASDATPRHPSGRPYRSNRPIEPNPLPFSFMEDPSQIEVPGLDTTVTPLQQCEQLDQRITHKLENIDARMANINDIIATRILPAVKRFAIATEPVREASNFWLSFYEKAANIRIPMEHDQSAHEEEAEETIQHIYEENTPEHSTATDEPQDTTSESSFMPGLAAVSSTPARVGGSTDGSSTGPSWMSSMDSPLYRLSREMEALTKDDLPPADYLAASTREDSSDLSAVVEATVRQDEPISAGDTSTDSYEEGDSLLSDSPPPSPQRRRSKGKGKAQPLLRNVLRRRASAAAEDSMRSPRKIPELKKQNPYLPSDTPGSKWDGTVDLSRGYPREPSPPPEEPQQPNRRTTFHLARPPRTNAPTLGRTPKKQAAQRITGDMLRAIVNSQRKPVLSRPAPSPAPEDTSSGLSTPPSMSRYGRMEESTGTSSMATPPSMSRYAADDGDESPIPSPPSMSKYAKFMERLQPSAADASVLEAADRSLYGARDRSPSPSPVPPSSSRTRYAPAPSAVDSGDTMNSTMDLPSASRYAAPARFPAAADDDTGSSASFTDTFAGRYVARPASGALPPSASAGAEDPSLASLRSMMRDAGLEGFDIRQSPAGDLSADSSFGQTMRPEQLAAFGRSAHDSFDSEGSGDSFDDTRGGGAAAALRFLPPAGGDEFDDSFDDDEELPVGGGPREETVFGLAPQRRYRQNDLVLHGDALLAHTTDFARAIGEGGVEQTPTPAGWRES